MPVEGMPCCRSTRPTGVPARVVSRAANHRESIHARGRACLRRAATRRRCANGGSAGPTPASASPRAHRRVSGCSTSTRKDRPTVSPGSQHTTSSCGDTICTRGARCAPGRAVCTCTTGRATDRCVTGSTCVSTGQTDRAPGSMCGERAAMSWRRLPCTIRGAGMRGVPTTQKPTTDLHPNGCSTSSHRQRQRRRRGSRRRWQTRRTASNDSPHGYSTASCETSPRHRQAVGTSC